MKKIAQFYMKNLSTDKRYSSSKPCKDTKLLFPEFLEQLNNSIKDFNAKYPDVEVVFVETYRSNELQLIHFNNGASKIKKDGMHHYGIAADLAFKIKGKFTYSGDYNFLRECHSKYGLYLLGAWDIGHVQFIPVSQQVELRKSVKSEIISFQKENDLIPDGIIGPKTYKKIISNL